MAKILKLVYNQVNQGTYFRAYHFARELIERGHQVTLVATSRGERWHVHKQVDGGLVLVEMPDLFRGPLRSGWDPWNTLRRIAWLNSHPFDLVHAYESRPTVIFPALYAKARGAKLVMDWCDWFGRGGSVEERPSRLVRGILRPVETFFEEHFRTKAAASTVICSVLREKAIALNVPAESILLLPNGTDPSLWPYQSLEEARQQVPFPKDSLVIGYVGSMFRKDGIFMAQAFDHVAERFPQAHLMLVGYSSMDLRVFSRFPERIHVTGYLANQAQVYQYLSACNLFWLPLQDTNANRGRLPYKLMDYMIVGRPVIATAVGDVAKILEEETFGCLSSVNPEGFAVRTIAIFHDNVWWKQLSLAARTAAEGKYRWNRLADDLERLYLQVLSQ